MNLISEMTDSVENPTHQKGVSLKGVDRDCQGESGLELGETC